MDLHHSLATIKYYLHDFWEIHGNPATTYLPGLRSGPWHVALITFAYLYFCTVLGPRFMKNRKPYDLRYVILAHNVFLIILNGFGFIAGFIGSNYGRQTIKCEEFDLNAKHYNTWLVLYLIYLYYLTKFVDFLDTVYFVLRKKFTHISYLHLFHHSVMPIGTYVTFKLCTFTNYGFVALINSFVHSIMYSYYAITIVTSADANNDNNNDNNSKTANNSSRLYNFTQRCKKYITQLQLIQFVMIMFHSLYFLFDKSCKAPKLLDMFFFFNSMYFFHLFFTFYKKNYYNKPVNEKVE